MDIFVIMLFLKMVGSHGYEDLSFNKSTSHSPEYYACWNWNYCRSFQSSSAVDRDNSTCTRNSPIGTNSPDQKAWWLVDFGEVYNVYDVSIIFRDYGEERVLRQRGRFAGFSIYLSNSSDKEKGILCYKNEKELPPLAFKTICIGLAQYLIFYNERLPNVSYPDGYERLSYTELCEVLVQGCTRTGFYGENCELPCPENCLERTCNIWNGTCFGCQSGWTGKFCKERCPFGSYGLNCKYLCTSRCIGHGLCNHVTGICENGCKAGWSGKYCEKECVAGKYGSDCIHNCSGHCQDHVPCNRENGHCISGCSTGYMGDVCDKRCIFGSYGLECQYLCAGRCKNNESCNHVTGICDNGCVAGFSGKQCDKECAVGKYGPNCVHNCSGYCMEDIPCNREDGRCETGCIPGYMGDICDKKCIPGSYGINCRYRCSGHCVNGEICNRYDGSCPRGCQEPYIGLACDIYHKTSSDASTITLAVLVSLLGIILIGVFVLLIRQKHRKDPQMMDGPGEEAAVNAAVMSSQAIVTDETQSYGEAILTEEPQNYEELSISENHNAYQVLHVPEFRSEYDNLEFAT